MEAQTDHDILITLVETVKNNHTNLSEKMQDIKENIKEIKDGTTTQLAQHEMRISAIEKLHNELNPKELVQDIQASKQWIHDYRLTYRTMLAIAGGIGSVITFILTLVSILLKVIKIG